MFCTNCGSLLEKGTLFCSNCGTKVNAELNVDEPIDITEGTMKIDEDINTSKTSENINTNTINENKTSSNSFNEQKTNSNSSNEQKTNSYSNSKTQKSEPTYYRVFGYVAIGLGVVGLVFCWFYFFGLFYSIPAMVFGSIGKKSTKYYGNANAGFVLGLIGTIVTVIASIIFIAIIATAIGVSVNNM